MRDGRRPPRARLRAALALGAALVCAAACQETKKLQAFPDTYAGVGLELRVEGSSAEVVNVIPGGPAEEAGVKRGDRIAKIDGDTVAGLTLAEVVAKLRGPIGSQVMLSLTAQGSEGGTVIVVNRRGLKKDEHGGYRSEKGE